MKRYLDREAIKEFIENNFKSVSEFCRRLNISRSHFDGMMNGKIACGKKTQGKLKEFIKDYDISSEDLFDPLPILMGDKRIKEILVTDKDGYLISSINSNNEITDVDYKVEYIPFD